jgi:hypothetical protein
MFHLYIAEKLREFDEDRLARIRYVDLRRLESQRASALGRTLGAAGRWMRRLGEALELWATPAHERETLRVALARTRRPE